MSHGSIIAELAKKRLHLLNKTAATNPDEKLEDFIVRVNPKLSKPLHLAPALEVLNKIHKEPIRLLLSVPPRHGKSYTVVHLLAQVLSRNPETRIAYITYGSDLSELFSRLLRQVCQEAGVELSPSSKAASHWTTKAGGSVDAVGVGGQITGRGFDLIIIDDPHRNRVDTESERIRNNVFEFCTSTAQSRLEPGGSIIVFHTRWHPDDLIGRLLDQKLEGWQYINIPALNEAGEALWPERYGVEDLKKIRARNEYDFWSLYMGSPRPRGGAVFNGVWTYDELPKDMLPKAKCIGLDLAYTAKTYADHSVALTGLMYEDTIYITNMVRRQVEAEKFAGELKTLRNSVPDATLFWFIGPIEKGIVSLFKKLGIYITTEVAKTDKFVRAQPVATSWNNGKVKVPADAPWLGDFLSEVLSFTGVGDSKDDIVDALAALHHPLLGKRLPRGYGQKPLGFF